MLSKDFPDFRRSLRACLLALAPLCVPILPAQAGEPSGLAQAELQRREVRAAEAQELLKSGDEAYEDARYAEAAAAYRGALDLLPEGAPALADLRAATVERFAQASVEVAREQRRLGDVKGAEATIEGVLEDGVAPGNIGALAMQEQILDPIRTNPAGSAEHTGDIEEVRLLLYKAQGAFDLGKYDEAVVVYEEVLRVDPFNKAARRGLERTSAAKSDYYRAAHDQTRAEMLAQVASGWELQPPPPESLVIPEDSGPMGPSGTDQLEKMKQIIIPAVFLEQVSIEEAIDYLRQQSIALDTFEVDPDQRGINFVLDLGDPDSEVATAIQAIRFDINLRSVPVEVALQYICDATRTVAIPQPYAVAVRPAGALSADMITKSYRVPPDFLTSGSAEVGAGAGESDNPFDNEPKAGLVATRLTAEEILKSRGVDFPEGASAAFNAGNSTLRVRNTVTNQALVDQIVEALSNSEPTAVIIEVKVIKTQQKDLEELGFDWLLSEFSLGGEGVVPGSDAAFLSGGSAGDALGDVPLPAGQFTRNGITEGNRSGADAISGNSIDELIQNPDRLDITGRTRAPGALWVNGELNDANVTMLMRGFNQKKGTDLVSVPSVVTRSGQVASVRVIREFIYPTEYEPPELPNSVGSDDVVIDLTTGLALGSGAIQSPVTPATPTSFTMKETGVILEVLPTVSADKRYVNLSLKPELTDFDGFVNYGSPIRSGQGRPVISQIAGIAGITTSPGVVITENRIVMPVFSVMATESALTVADGATVVIGGLLDERMQRVNDKVPILGDIPLVGRLFQSNVTQPVRTAVIFMVHVRVVDAGGRPFNP